MRRTNRHPLLAVFDNTLLVGLAGLLAGAVILFIAYKALTGLPGVPTYDVSADVPDAAALTKGADVRIGGARVGQVLAIHAEAAHDGRPPYARLDLRLAKHEGPLPADTTAEVRLASVLGGKYVALVPGHGRARIPAGGVIPLRNAVPSVAIDEALRIFRPETRAALQTTLGELGDAVAGRGVALNGVVGEVGRALPAVQRVLRVLVDPRTDVPGLVAGVAGTVGALAPVAGDLGTLVDRAAATAGALDAAGGALDRTLTELPPTETAATRALVRVRPTLARAAALARSLRPAGRELPGALAEVDATMRTATPVARRAGHLARPMAATFSDVDRFAREPSATGALEGLGSNDFATFGGSGFVGLGAILRSASDAQLHCNSLALWMRNLASVASEGDSGGNWLRMIPVVDFGQMLHADAPASNLHANVYPHEGAAECEAGNESYTPGRHIGNPAGRQSTHVELTTRPAGGR